MLLSWLRPRHETVKKPSTFRPRLESLDERITPDIGTGAHFLYATSTITATGALVIDFKEAGLGNVSEVPISVTGNVSATFNWYNKGGNRPMGTPFNVSQSLNVTQTFPVRNGQVTGTITIQPPAPPAEFLEQPHAANWTPAFTISYTNIALTSYQGTTQTATTAGEFNLDQSITSPIVVG